MIAKAVIVTPIYPGPGNPQAGIFIHRQVLNLARCGVHCRVLVYRPAPPRFPKRLVSRSWLRYYWYGLGWPKVLDGIPVKTVFYRRSWTAGEDVVPAIGGALCDWVAAHPDWQDTNVVYAQFLWTAGAAALALRERFGWPVAAIARGGELQGWHDKNPHCRRYVEQVLHLADPVLAVCQALRDRAERLVPGSGARIQVVYNGCDAKEFCPPVDKALTRRALGFDDTHRLLAFCGSLEKTKGIDELAEAWTAFSAGRPEWHLLVIGRCIDRQLEAKLRRAGNGRIHFAGEVPQDELLRYLRAADAYIQPSRLEGLANATMEAMAVGLPAISTDTYGQRELIRHGENGWLVPTGDVVALQAALESLASDLAGARRLGLEARRTIETAFNPRRHAARLAEILSKTARQGCAGPLCTPAC